MVVSQPGDSSRIPPEQQIRDSLIRSMDANGATPSRFLELLDAVTQDGMWRKLADRDGYPFATFTAFVTTERPEGLGLHDKDDLRKHLALQHREEREPYRRQVTADRMADMRQRVGQLLGLEVPGGVRLGRPSASEEKPSGTGFLPKGAVTVDTILARLKRDDPAEAQRVISGEKTANAAARDKGWRKPRIVLSGPDRVGKRLRAYYTDPEDRAVLVQYLQRED